MARTYALVLTALLLPYLLSTPATVSGSNASTLIEVIAVDDTSFTRALRVAEAYGRVVYLFPELRGFAAYVPRPLIKVLRDIQGLTVSEAVRVSVLSEELPSDCSLHGTNLTWNLDIINVPTVHEVYGIDGSGVYVAVLDTGLEPQWRDYFPEDRIASEFGAAFLGAQAIAYHITNAVLNRRAWEADTHGHGMHVTSIIIGFSVYGLYRVDGVAPGARVIPVKVIGNAGWGFSTDVAAGIYYVTSLYITEVTSGGNALPPEGVVNPVVISMSLGGPEPSPLMLRAVDYAIRNGVFIVAAAGNRGREGMDYPGAYSPVISVGAVGWVGEWFVNGTYSPRWWTEADVPEDLRRHVYVTEFSARERDGQDLDVLAPGSWVVGPYTPYGAAHPPRWARGMPGQYYYLRGTSMATAHISGILSLALQADMRDGKIDLNQGLAEELLERSTLKITWYSAAVYDPISSTYVTIEWDGTAVGSGLVLAHLVVLQVLDTETT